MPHKSQDDLLLALQKAEKLVPIGAQYTHYKNLSQTYVIVGHAVLEANNEAGIIYQAEYGEHITFVRPISNWLEEINRNGKTQQRFSRTAKGPFGYKKESKSK